MVQINPNNSELKGDYRDTLNRFTGNKSEKDGIELLFKLADTNKDGKVDDAELRTLEKNLSEKSIFGDGVFDKKEFNDYVKDYNKPFKSDPSQMLEFSKEDMEKMKEMKPGITQAMFDKFKEFCNIRLGNGGVNNQVGINGKLSLDADITSKQGQTGDCYFITAINLLAKANDGDLSDYIKPDGQGGGVISYKGLTNSQGGKFDAKVSENEINLVREYQKDHPEKYEHTTGYVETLTDDEGNTYSILSKGDDDVLAFELAEMKREAYNEVMNVIACPNSKKTPNWLKAKKTELVKNYLNGLSSDDKKELSKAILHRQKVEKLLDEYNPELNDFISEQKVTDKELKEFKLDEKMAEKINNNPLAFRELMSNFSTCISDEDGNDKEMIDAESIDKINAKIASWSELNFNNQEMSEFRKSMLEQLLQTIKADAKIQSSISISDDEINRHTIKEADLTTVIRTNKTAREKFESYLMDYFSNEEIKDEDMLEKYHGWIIGGSADTVLTELTGAESKTIVYDAPPNESDIKKWIDNATNEDYSHVVVSIKDWKTDSGRHAVLLKGYDEQTGKLQIFDPSKMNNEVSHSSSDVYRLMAIKLPQKGQQ